jgi:NAD(P)-dependent dehydrogenase (short-subunit alcohol dehydrogenase family)
MVSDHASPLATIGGVDAGGQNIYVAHTARVLARSGYAVDVLTRRDAKDLPPVVARTVASEARAARDRGEPYTVCHAHFFMSGLVARALKELPPALEVRACRCCAQAAGDIVNVASTAAKRGGANASAYPRESVVAEITVLPVQETSWP